MIYLANSVYIEPDCRPAPVYADLDWLEEGVPRPLCDECQCIDRRYHPEPCRIVLADPPEGQVWAQVIGTQTLVFRKEFLRDLRPYLDRFVMGDCLAADGTLIEQYATCYCSDAIVLRGNRFSRYAICPACGSVRSCLANGPRYVVRGDLTDAAVHQDHAGHLYLHESIADTIECADRADGLRMDWIPERDAPCDGVVFDNDGKEADPL